MNPTNPTRPTATDDPVITIPQSSRPPDTQLRTSYRIVRAPSSGELTALILSQTIYGCDTHYFSGRTRPHTSPYCEACDSGQAFRWQGYLGCLLTKTRDLVLFEFTAPAAAPLLEYQDHNKSLDGAIITAYRSSPKPNARVIIRIARGDVALYHAPPPPNVPDILARIWGIDRLIAHETQRAEAMRHAQTANPQPDRKP